MSLDSFAPIFGNHKVDASQIVNDRLFSRHLDQHYFLVCWDIISFKILVCWQVGEQTFWVLTKKCSTLLLIRWWWCKWKILPEIFYVCLISRGEIVAITVHVFWYLVSIIFFNRDMRLFEMLVFIIRIIWILSNIWLMFICLKRFILMVNGWLLIWYDSLSG